MSGGPSSLNTTIMRRVQESGRALWESDGPSNHLGEGKSRVPRGKKKGVMRTHAGKSHTLQSEGNVSDRVAKSLLSVKVRKAPKGRSWAILETRGKRDESCL